MRFLSIKKKCVTYTSTLPNIVMEEVVEFAKRKNVTRNKVIEVALKRLFEGELKEDLESTFKMAAQDRELEEMAEEDIGDYNKQI